MSLVRDATRRLLLLLACLVVWASGARAEPLPAARAEPSSVDRFASPVIDRDCSVALPSEACPRQRVGLLTRFGTATVPFSTEVGGSAHGWGGELRLRAASAPLRGYTFGVELPLALLHLDEPSGDSAQKTTWGNPALTVRRVEPLWTSTTRSFLATMGLVLALPLGERSEADALRAGRAQAIARALDGNRRPYYFLPGYLTLAPSLGLEHRIRRFGATLQLELPVAVRVADAALGAAHTRHVALNPVLYATGRLQATHVIELALFTAGMFGAPPPLSVRRPARAFQLTMEPAISLRTGRHHLLGASVIIPVAGALGFDAAAARLESTVRW